MPSPDSVPHSPGFNEMLRLWKGVDNLPQQYLHPVSIPLYGHQKLFQALPTSKLSQSISVSQHSAAYCLWCSAQIPKTWLLSLTRPADLHPEDMPCSKLQSSVTLRRDSASGACANLVDNSKSSCRCSAKHVARMWRWHMAHVFWQCLCISLGWSGIWH